MIAFKEKGAEFLPRTLTYGRGGHVLCRGKRQKEKMDCKEKMMFSISKSLLIQTAVSLSFKSTPKMTEVKEKAKEKKIEIKEEKQLPLWVVDLVGDKAETVQMEQKQVMYASCC